jgi:adenosylcobalamin-dependent ribonucleoside-triphosphate reductase
MSYNIKKRDGKEVAFDGDKIVRAILSAMVEVNEFDYELAEKIAKQIELDAKERTVHDIERRVIGELYRANFNKAADAYSEYKARRDLARVKGKKERRFLTEEFLSEYKHKPDPFINELGKFVYYRTYSRPIPEENRRERWWETVARVVEFSFDLQMIAMKRQGIPVSEKLMESLRREAKETYDMMYNLKVFPSGRTLWVGGTSSSYIYPLSNFNCSFVAIDHFDKFSEMFFVLMLGTGVGLSVERKYINKLPKVNTNIEIHSKKYHPVSKVDRKEHTEIKVLNKSAIEIIIGDSKSGWSEAIRHYFDIMTSKQYGDIKFLFINYDNVRPAGERLKTFGGYASGPGAIEQMFEKIHAMLLRRNETGKQWYKIRPLDALDISTIIAENVVSGGTRRSAEIVFCDPDEVEVLEAKSNIYNNVNGEWVANQEILHRFLSNNTVFYHERPSEEVIHKQFETMRYSGEPKLFCWAI